MRDIAIMIRRRQSLETKLNITTDVANVLHRAARQNGLL